jgi:radical SAM superfamily enzyme YgiQ (UPF0313 family)
MKVLLISANTVRVPYYIYPLGLDYVAGAISPRHEVAIADVNIMKEMHAVAGLINEFRPDLVGLSLRNIDNTDAIDTKGFVRKYRELADAIRACTGAPIVLGGSGFTIFPHQLMEALGADYGIIGEGERLDLLLDALERGTDPAAVPGVIVKQAPESYPPPLGAFSRRRFTPGAHGSFYIARGGMLNLQTKRGCGYNCIYCTYPRIEGKELRLVPPDEAAADALELERAGAKYFFVTDSVINSDYGHSLEVARAFRRAGLSIPWGAFFAPTRPPAGYYEELRAAGLTHVEFGTEALSDRMLASIRKPFNVADVHVAHEAALAARLHIAHYFLLGGPGETRDTVAETIGNAKRLEKCVIFFFCGMRIYPHTALYDIALAEGQIAASDDLLEPVFYQSKDIGSEEINRMIAEEGAGRENWFIGTVGRRTTRLVARLHKQGHTGPLWEHMIR